jgi:putative ABC transport system permease protein
MRLAGIAHDWRAAVKNHRRRPAFLVTAAVMLAAGLGFNTALYAVVRSVLLDPLPYAEPSRIVMLWTGRHPDGAGAVNSYPDFADWKSAATSFDAMAAYNISFGAIESPGQDPEEIGGATVSPDFFRVLGVRAHIGRTLEPGDYGPATDLGRPIVISHRLWQRRFGGDPGVLRRTITLAERPRIVVGVLPPEFRQPEPFWDQTADFWSPQIVSDEMRAERASRFLRVIARLGAGVEIDRARAEMDAIGKRLMAQSPATNTASVVLAPVADELIGDTRPLLLLYLGAAVLVLALAMANIANLLLARAVGRRAELALRAALGADRGRLMSQLIAESTIAGLAGGLAGLGVAAAGLHALRLYAPLDIPGADRIGIDAGVAAFAVVLSMLTGALCGLAPAWRVTRERMSSSLVEARGTHGPGVSRARSWLVGLEIALAVPLVVGAVLLATTLVKMQRVDPGFEAARVLQFRVTLAGERYKPDTARESFFRDLNTRLAAVPGADAVGIVSSLPLGGLNNFGGSIVYEALDGTPAQLPVGFRAASAGYFPAMGIPVRAGAPLSDAPGDADRVVINEKAAALMWGGANAIGRRIRFGLPGDATPEPWLTIVGVVGNVRHEGLTRDHIPEVFRPYAALPASTMTVAVRSREDPAALAQSVRQVVRDADSRLPLVGFGPATQYVEGQLAGARFGVLCAFIFGGLAIVLATFGIFAVLSFLVSHRTREIGVRMALGATPGQVRALVLRESLTPAIAGGAAGALMAAWLVRGLTSQLFGVSPGDPLAYAGAVALLLAVSMAASWWPARRAMGIDPIKALREQ